MRKQLLIAIALLILSACNENDATKYVELTIGNDIQNNVKSTSIIDSVLAVPKIDTVDLPPEKYESSEITEIGWELMGTESFGSITIGMDSVSIVSIIGVPDSISKIQLCDVDGGLRNDWVYSNLGLIIGINRISIHPDEKYHQALSYALTVTNGSNIETNRKIHIGSTKSEVLSAYKLAIKDTIGYKGGLIAGTAYGGLMFKFENDTVTQIFLGAGAE